MGSNVQKLYKKIQSWCQIFSKNNGDTLMVEENSEMVETLVEQARVRLERADGEEGATWQAQALERLERAAALGAGAHVKKALEAKTAKEALAALLGSIPLGDVDDKTPAEPLRKQVHPSPKKK